MEKQRLNEQREAILTVKEASDILKLSTQTVRKLMRENKIEYFKIGSNYRIKRKSIENIQNMNQE